MNCVEQILDFIDGLAVNALFASRDCLNFGARNTVDKTLSRLVRCGYLVRLARGVFVRSDRRNDEITAQEIAIFKASVFYKNIATHAFDLAHMFGFIEQPNEKTIFSSSGTTSSFDTIHCRIYFRKTSPKKFLNQQSTAGQVIRALWQLRLTEPTKAIESFFSQMPQMMQAELAKSAHRMPNWLTVQVRSLLGAG